MRRRELVGPNAIPMKVPSWWTVAGNEFCSPFYVYRPGSHMFTQKKTTTRA